MAEIVLTVNNKEGLHARPAKDFINKVREFKSKVTIQNLSRPESKEVAVTPVGLLNIAARQGHAIRVRAEGADEAEVLAALKQLVDNNFGERDQA
ncbi:MAG TPA: HPr family phosphocarrier protein [Roseiflexaceae bacterium]|nr:HPr family phosphocarrier protein [Roseiflexaceae bacterium]